MASCAFGARVYLIFVARCGLASQLLRVSRRSDMWPLFWFASSFVLDAWPCWSCIACMRLLVLSVGSCWRVVARVSCVVCFARFASWVCWFCGFAGASSHFWCASQSVSALLVSRCLLRVCEFVGFAPRAVPMWPRRCCTIRFARVFREFCFSGGVDV